MFPRINQIVNSYQQGHPDEGFWNVLAMILLVQQAAIEICGVLQVIWRV
jgi:hypothetical protein